MSALVVRDLASMGDSSVLGATDSGLVIVRRHTVSLVRTEGAPDRPVIAVAATTGVISAATPDRLFCRQASGWRAFTYPEKAAIHDVACTSDGRAAVATDRGLWIFDNAKWSILRAVGGRGLSSDNVRAVAIDGAGTIWVGTDRGIDLVTAGWTEHIRGADGLPLEDVTCITLGPEGVAWAGSTQGLQRLDSGRWHYYWGRRWLPGNQVRAVSTSSDGSAWVATEGGIARIYTRLMTLEDKCAIYDHNIEARHTRFGYVGGCGMRRPGDVSSFVYSISDNDGLWTSLYVAAQSFRYATTGDSQARRRARRSLEALMFLEKITGIPGFPARAVMHKTEKGEVDQAPGEWHESADGKWLWKGDTSSDEIAGHFFAYSTYYDLVAKDKEKREIRSVITRIMDHIIDNGFVLVDADGKRTTWGFWSPQILNGAQEQERGLNSLEILSHLKVAYHMTQRTKYQRTYLELIRKHHYAANTIYQKVVPPREVNHSDDQLAMLAYYPLIKYETDPAIRRLYLLSLQRSWQIERPERSPFFDVIFGSLTGRSCDLQESVQTLREIPLNMTYWEIRNSHRADLAPGNPMGYGAYGKGRVLPADERPLMRWNGNPWAIDSYASGRSEDDGTYFLLPYWMLRYHVLLDERKDVQPVARP